MRRIRWSPAAAQDLENIHNYLYEHYPSLMQHRIRRLYDAAYSLKDSANRGRVGKMQGTRELVMAPLPYVIVYAVDAELVHILRVLHTSQEWPVN